jgi:hypothetical protein
LRLLVSPEGRSLERAPEFNKFGPNGPTGLK